MDEGIHQKLTEFLTECIKRKDGEGGEPKLACCSQILPLHFKLAWKNVSSFWTCPIFNCHVMGDNSRPRPPREYLSAQFVQNDKKLHSVLLKCREKYVQSTVAGVRNWIEIMARDSIDNFESRLFLRVPLQIRNTWGQKSSQVFHQKFSKKALWKNTKRRRTVSKELYTKQPITGLFFPWSTIDPDFVFTTFLSRPSLYYIWCHWGPLLEI